MGYFGTFIYRDGEWRDHGGGERELVLDIHDSDIATVDYRPAPPGLGRFYLGYQPRDYFDDPDASWPVDIPAEIDGFVEIRREHGYQRAGAVPKKPGRSSDWSSTRPRAVSVHWVPSALTLSWPQVPGPQTCSPA